jgi:hypothetical protein
MQTTTLKVVGIEAKGWVECQNRGCSQMGKTQVVKGMC